MKKTITLVLLSCLFIGICGILLFTFQNRKRINKEEPAASVEANSLTTAIETKEATLEEIESIPVVPPKQEITLLFSGDILLSDYILNNYEQHGISGVLSEAFIQEMNTADITMVNQEFPFSLRGSKAADKQYTFRVDPKKVILLKELGVDIVTLANNHTLDFGEEALLDTCSTLEEADIQYVGAGNNLDRAKQLETITVNDKIIGFLGASRVIPVPGWNATSNKPGVFTTYDPALLLEEIKKAKELCDVVIVYVHWGIEREELPQDYQRSLGMQYIDAGADLVIGSHPHVLQGIEYYEGKPIVYSLGNFLFGSSIPKTMLLKVTIDENEKLQMYVLPGTAVEGYTDNLLEEKAKEIYSYLEAISFGVSITENGEIIQKN